MSNRNDALLDAALQAIKVGGGDGIFLVSGAQKHNVMTIGWAMAGINWTKPVFMAVVRPSRYTHSLLEEHGEFAVCTPAPGAMRDALRICGSKSGRDLDKVAACGLRLAPSREIAVPVIEGCEWNIECRLLGKTELNLDLMKEEVSRRYYKMPDGSLGDAHTMYFGEILAAYR